MKKKQNNTVKNYLKQGIERGKKLDHYQMLKDINRLVDSDFCLDMELKPVSPKPNYSQKEACEMARIISRVGLISHCITCGACQVRYIK